VAKAVGLGPREVQFSSQPRFVAIHGDGRARGWEQRSGSGCGAVAGRAPAQPDKPSAASRIVG
ncbi:MAG TPA: hypothetical protein VK391_00960, partial [Allosphingosinicella sp.]|nr:hypothetical protein [Allosphingosinicella sp.]